MVDHRYPDHLEYGVCLLWRVLIVNHNKSPEEGLLLWFRTFPICVLPRVALEHLNLIKNDVWSLLILTGSVQVV